MRSQLCCFGVGVIIGIIMSWGTDYIVGNALRNHRRALIIRNLKDGIRWTEESERGVHVDLHIGTIAFYPHDQDVPEGWIACQGQARRVHEGDALFLLAIAAYGGECPGEVASERRDDSLELKLPKQTEQERDMGVVKIIKLRY